MAKGKFISISSKEKSPTGQEMKKSTLINSAMMQESIHSFRKASGRPDWLRNTQRAICRVSGPPDAYRPTVI